MPAGPKRPYRRPTWLRPDVWLDPLRCAKKKPVAVLRQALYWDLRGLEFVGDAEANFVGLQINIRIGRNSKRF